MYCVNIMYVLLIQIQFGHAGAYANAEAETADAKNKVSYVCTEVY